MKPRLYVIPASHPCAVAEAAFRLKGVEYSTLELPNVVHWPVMRVRFGRRTVPAMTVNGTKVQGSREIVHWLEREHPDPPLLSDDPEVERAETWGDEVLQSAARSIVLCALGRHTAATPSYLAKSSLPIPAPVARALGRAIAPISAKVNGVDDEVARAAVQELPGNLAVVDRWIEDGLLGGEQPNAADLQIGASLAMLRTIEDVAGVVDAHACAQLADRWFPDHPGHIPAGALPPEWVQR